MIGSRIRMENSPDDIRVIVRIRPISENKSQIISARLGRDYDGDVEVLDEGVDEHSITLGCRVHWRIEQRGDERLYCSRFRKPVEVQPS